MECFKNTTVQTVSISASIRIFSVHIFQRGLPKASQAVHGSSALPLCFIESIRRQTHLSVIRLLADNTCQPVTLLHREIL